jgi:hypothetical protein
VTTSTPAAVPAISEELRAEHRETGDRIEIRRRSIGHRVAVSTHAIHVPTMSIAVPTRERNLDSVVS